MSSTAVPEPTPQESLSMLLRQVKSALVRAQERELANEGVELRFSQVLALKRLGCHGPMSAGELARSLGHDGGALTRMLDQLEEKDYLRRQPDPEDRRALRIELTTAGKKLCRQLETCSERVLDCALAPLRPAERKQLLDYLQRMFEALRQTD